MLSPPPHTHTHTHTHHHHWRMPWVIIQPGQPVPWRFPRTAASRSVTVRSYNTVMPLDPSRSVMVCGINALMPLDPSLPFAGVFACGEQRTCGSAARVSSNLTSSVPMVVLGNTGAFPGNPGTDTQGAIINTRVRGTHWPTFSSFVGDV